MKNIINTKIHAMNVQMEALLTRAKIAAVDAATSQVQEEGPFAKVSSEFRLSVWQGLWLIFFVRTSVSETWSDRATRPFLRRTKFSMRGSRPWRPNWIHWLLWSTASIEHPRQARKDWQGVWANDDTPCFRLEKGLFGLDEGISG